MSLIRARYRAVNTIMNLPSGGGYVGLLDLFPNAAAAYSLRKLRAAYSGAAVRVRRSSDNTEQDIGFTAQGELDTASLLSFVNADVEKVLNGDFSNGSTNWIISNGSVTGGEYVSGTLSPYQSGIKQVPFTYTGTGTLTFDLTLNSGSLRVDDGAGLKIVTSSGAQSITLTNPNKLEFNAYNLGFDGIIDNISFIPTNVDGFVTTWYDQSLSNNATQTTATNQPKIVSAGSLVTENGKPAIDFDGVNDRLITSSFASTLSQPNTTFIVNNAPNNTSDNTLIDGIIVSTRHLLIANANNYTLNAGAFVNTGVNSDAQSLLYTLWNGASSEFASDGGTPNIINIGTHGLTGLNIGTNFVSSNANDGNVQEIILYNSNQSANRTGIEGSIQEDYKIY